MSITLTSYSPSNGKESSSSLGVRSGFLGQIRYSLFQSNYGSILLSYNIPRMIPSLNSLVIVNFMLKSRSSIRIIYFQVSRWAFPPLQVGLVLLNVRNMIGSFFFLVGNFKSLDFSQIYKVEFYSYIYDGSHLTILKADGGQNCKEQVTWVRA